MKLCPICATAYPAGHRTCPTHGAVLVETQELAPGTMIRDCYRIERTLGHGGMGIVYLAEHTLMGEPRALKFLSSALVSNPAFVQRFMQEARAANKLRHPNIVQTLELGQAEDGSFFLSMEFVDGPSLRALLDQSSLGLPVERTFNIVRGVAEGLGAAHAMRMVHRDIKPENILLAWTADSETAKIVDFGIVAITDSMNHLTQTGRPLMTAQYAAPEQWRGILPASELDGRTDLYSLGCMFFEMLTGQLPFKSDTYEGWFEQHVHTMPPAPSQIRPELARFPGLDSLVRKLMAKERGDRPANVGEFLAELGRVMAFAGQGQQSGLQSGQQPGYEATTVLGSGPSYRSGNQPGYVSGYQPTMAIERPPGSQLGRKPNLQSGQQPGWQPDQTPNGTPNHEPGYEPTVTLSRAPSYAANSDSSQRMETTLYAPVQPQQFSQSAQYAPGLPPSSPAHGFSEPSLQETIREISTGSFQRPAQIPVQTSAQGHPARQSGQLPGLAPGRVQGKAGGLSRDVRIAIGVLATMAVLTALGVILALKLYKRANLPDSSSGSQPGSSSDNSPGNSASGAGAPSSGSETISVPDAQPKPPASQPQVTRQETGQQNMASVPQHSPPMVPAQPALPSQPGKSTLPDVSATARQAIALYNRKDYAQAAPLLDLACKGGHAESCDYLGGMYQHQLGVPLDYGRAISLFDKACQAGSMAACGNEGLLYQGNVGVVQDFQHAITLYTRACDGDYSAACDSLGYMYQFKQGVAQDYARAASLYDRSCTGGNMAGCGHLGYLYQHKLGVVRDYPRAMALFSKACDSGDASSCNGLGMMYEESQGVPEDDARAVALYSKACDANNAVGCSDLGNMYRDGKGVSKDPVKARSLLTKGCSMGSQWGCDGLRQMR